VTPGLFFFFFFVFFFLELRAPPHAGPRPSSGSDPELCGPLQRFLTPRPRRFFCFWKRCLLPRALICVQPHPQQSPFPPRAGFLAVSPSSPKISFPGRGESNDSFLYSIHIQVPLRSPFAPTRGPFFQVPMTTLVPSFRLNFSTVRFFSPTLSGDYPISTSRTSSFSTPLASGPKIKEPSSNPRKKSRVAGSAPPPGAGCQPDTFSFNLAGL